VHIKNTNSWNFGQIRFRSVFFGAGPDQISDQIFHFFGSDQIFWIILSPTWGQIRSRSELEKSAKEDSDLYTMPKRIFLEFDSTTRHFFYSNLHIRCLLISCVAKHLSRLDDPRQWQTGTDTVYFKPNTTYCGAWQFDGGYRDTYFCTKNATDDYIITNFYTKTTHSISHSKLIGSCLPYVWSAGIKLHFYWRAKMINRRLRTGKWFSSLKVYRYLFRTSNLRFEFCHMRFHSSVVFRMLTANQSIIRMMMMREQKIIRSHRSMSMITVSASGHYCRNGSIATRIRSAECCHIWWASSRIDPIPIADTKCTNTCECSRYWCGGEWRWIAIARVHIGNEYVKQLLCSLLWI